MRFGIPHIVRGLAWAAPVLLAACEPSWRGTAPVFRAAQMDARCGGGVTVFSGDTVFGIARRCNVSVREVIEANDLAPPYIVHPGQTLRMPGGGSEHLVRRGDTLSQLARQYGVDFQSLARTNNKSAPYTIFVGERLRIPGTYGATQTARSSEAETRSTGSLVIASPNSVESRRPVLPQPAPEPVQQPAEARHAAFQPQQALPSPPPPLAGKGFVWPLRGEVIAEFGSLGKGQHNDGINIAAPKGAAVHAAENGVVAYAGNELKGFGNLLLIKHADGWMTAYAHADRLLVAKGESVTRGQQVATVGATGNVSSSQLHFEIRKGTQAVNPLEYLDGRAFSRLLADRSGA